MSRAIINGLRRSWRTDLFTAEAWQNDPGATFNPGEAGGYRVLTASAPYGAYLKPTRVCDDDNPRAANEKIVADLAFELGFSVPPVLLYRRPAPPAGEETRCCLSLVMYPEQYEWGLLWDISGLSVPVRAIIRGSISRYSDTLALDLLIGQTDRNNARNVILGVDGMDLADSAFLFLDHAYTLNYGNRWSGVGWQNIDMVPIPQLFRDSLTGGRVREGAGKIAALSDETVAGIVQRIPDDYMTATHKNIVIAGLIGRKARIPDFVARNF